jgi:hypothetical protein
MYYIYQEKLENNKIVFKKIEETSLAGDGLIARYLKKTISNSTTEPYSWHIESNQLFNTLELPGNALVIDLKPKSKTKLSLFKVKNVWGYSSSGWTPIMLELKEIVNDENPNDYNRETVELEKEKYERGDSVFTFLYLRGTIRNGKLVGEGRWRFSGPSPTNSVLLWPKVRDYFIRKMQNAKLDARREEIIAALGGK